MNSGNRFQLTLRVCALYGLAQAIAICIVGEACFVAEGISLLRQITAGIGAARDVSQRIGRQRALTVKDAIAKTGCMVERIFGCQLIASRIVSIGGDMA